MIIVDVRSPKEYLNGHIPKAVNVPLFTDEERHVIGKTYKEQGKPRAVEQGKKKQIRDGEREREE